MAVVIALAQGNHEGNSTLVYCLEVFVDLENEEFEETFEIGQSFRLYNKVGQSTRWNPIWLNDQLRNEHVTCGTVIFFQRIDGPSTCINHHHIYLYRGNVEKVLVSRVSRN